MRTYVFAGHTLADDLCVLVDKDVWFLAREVGASREGEEVVPGHEGGLICLRDTFG